MVQIDWKKKKNTRFSRAERNVFLTSLMLRKNMQDGVSHHCFGYTGKETEEEKA
jgi:hypothetical protein